MVGYCWIFGLLRCILYCLLLSSLYGLGRVLCGFGVFLCFSLFCLIVGFLFGGFCAFDFLWLS